jgi:hypothetical protein
VTYRTHCPNGTKARTLCRTKSARQTIPRTSRTRHHLLLTNKVSRSQQERRRFGSRLGVGYAPCRARRQAVGTRTPILAVNEDWSLGTGAAVCAHRERGSVKVTRQKSGRTICLPAQQVPRGQETHSRQLKSRPGCGIHRRAVEARPARDGAILLPRNRRR